MAKISARNCTEVARVTFKTLDPIYAGIFVLRSDGKLLRRFTGDTPSGYSIVGSVKPGTPLTADTLARIVARRGLQVLTVSGVGV